MKYKKSLTAYLFIGKTLFSHKKNRLYLFISYIFVYFLYVIIFIFVFFSCFYGLNYVSYRTLLHGFLYASFLTAKTIDIRISIEIFKFREQSNLATLTVNISSIVAHQKYSRSIIHWIHPVIDSIATEIIT